jgi:hypothetical protein
VVLDCLEWLQADLGTHANRGIPAWQIETVVGGTSIGEQLLYTVDTLLMKDNHLYNIEFLIDPLKAPEVLPVAHKMIDSIKITDPMH